MTQILRKTLAEAGRVLALEGQGDYTAGHVSARLPGDPARFLMKPSGIGLEEITPKNIVTVNLEGEKVAGTLKRHNEVFIHSEILRARPDVMAVVHTHPRHAVAFSSLGKPLQAVGHSGAIFHGGLPVFAETTDLITTKPRGQAVAKCLGAFNALLLRNHGIVTCGGSLEEAVWFALKLEDACRMQLLAESAGGARLLADPADARAKGTHMNRAEAHANVFGYLLRRARRRNAP
jgi:L-fuculose-phosphate aldolase